MDRYAGGAIVMIFCAIVTFFLWTLFDNLQWPPSSATTLFIGGALGGLLNIIINWLEAD